LQQPAGNPHFAGISLRSAAVADLAQQMRVERMAWSEVLVEGIGVLYLKFAPPDRPPCAEGGA